MHFVVGKSRDETCRACRTAWGDTLVTTSATGVTRMHDTRSGAPPQRGVEWTIGHVHLTFSRSCSWDWCKHRA